MAAKEGPVVQQIELSSLNLPQLMQLKQQLDQVCIKLLFCKRDSRCNLQLQRAVRVVCEDTSC
jgi:hypothetical protein